VLLLAIELREIDRNRTALEADHGPKLEIVGTREPAIILEVTEGLLCLFMGLKFNESIVLKGRVFVFNKPNVSDWLASEELKEDAFIRDLL